MAEVSFLHLPEDDHDLFLEEISAVDSFSYWPHHRFAGSTCGFDIEDDLSVEIRNENAVVSSSERKNQVNFVMDLFHQRVEESNLMGTRENGSNTVNESAFGATEENYDVGRVELGLGLRLGLINQENDDDNNNNNHGAANNVVIEDDEDYNFGGFAVSDCGDDFYIAKRRENGECRNCNASSSRVSGLRAVWVESDSDGEIEVEVEGVDNGLLGVHDEEEDFGVENVNDDDGDALSVPIRWEALLLDEEEEHGEVNRDFEWEEDHAEVLRDFEWEEVDGGIDEREVLSLLADPEDEEEGEGSISVLNFSGLEEDGERGRRLSNLDWEVLLNVSNLDSNPELENEAGPYFGDHDDYIYTAEYEMMFGQFADVENAGMGRPPASKAVVKELPSVVITKEDVADEKALCAVCKDQIEVGEEGKQLPCSHRYHGDCIIPWLGIRNTCPVCRFELPTDDPDYEQRRLRIAARVAS